MTVELRGPGQSVLLPKPTPEAPALPQYKVVRQIPFWENPGADKSKATETTMVTTFTAFFKATEKEARYSITLNGEPFSYDEVWLKLGGRIIEESGEKEYLMPEDSDPFHPTTP